MKQRDRRRTIWEVLLDHDQEIEVIQEPQTRVVETCEGEYAVQTPLQKITGKWPGDETIEELLEALRQGDCAREG